MPANQLYKIIQKREALIDAVPSEFIAYLERAQNGLAGELLDFIKGMKTAGGKVLAVPANIQMALRLQQEMRVWLRRQGYYAAITDFGKQYEELLKQSREYYRALDLPGTFTARDTDILAKMRAADLNFLTVNDQRVIDATYNSVTSAVYSNKSFRELAGELERLHTDTLIPSKIPGQPPKQLNGLLKRYNATYAATAFAAFDRKIQNIKSAQLGLEYFLYSGGLIKDSREWCVDHAGKVYSKEEIESWESIPWTGKAEGRSIWEFLGGWNCQHILSPVTEQMAGELGRVVEGKGAGGAGAGAGKTEAGAEVEVKSIGQLIQQNQKNIPVSLSMQDMAVPAALIDSDLKNIIGRSLMFRKIGDAKGTNLGGLFEGIDGQKRYVKMYDDTAQAWNEHLTNSIYRELGINAPASQVFEYQGKFYYASDFVEAAEQLKTKTLTKKLARKILDGYAADVFTANWDVIGMELDNILVGAKNTLYRIDNGGSLLFRARAGRKKTIDLLGIAEYEGFANASINPSYAKIIKRAGLNSAAELGEDLIGQIEAIEKLKAKYGNWGRLVDEFAPGLSVADRQDIVNMLSARLELLSKKKTEIREFLKILEQQKAGFAEWEKGLGQVSGYRFKVDELPAFLEFSQKLEKDYSYQEKIIQKLFPDDDFRIKHRNAIEAWAKEYSQNKYHKEVYKELGKILNGKPTDSETGKLMMEMLVTRANRWAVIAKELHIPIPETFYLYRGVKGNVYIHDVVKAWADDRTSTLRLRMYRAASFSFSKSSALNFARGSDTVLYAGEIPFKNTLADMLADDANFLQRYFSEAECVVISPKDNFISIAKNDVTVKFRGQLYNYNQRQQLIDAWVQEYGSIEKGPE